MKRFLLVFCLFLTVRCALDEREPKFFFRPKVQTVVSLKRIPQFVTEIVPSSCVVIDPTLTPCRHVRNLEIYPSIPTRILKTETPQQQVVETQSWKPIVHPSESHQSPTPPLRIRPQQVKSPSPHWNWNLFSLFRVENITYTTTKTEYVTTTVEDPHSVVSFSIKGCRPSKIPFNLPECAKIQDLKQDENIIIMAPLKFISSDVLIAPSKSENSTDEEIVEEKNETLPVNN